MCYNAIENNIKKEEINMYFDNAATTKVDNEAIQIIYDSLQKDYFNPSALYNEGRNNYEIIRNAKHDIGNCINATDPEKQIYFTSGGTEGNNWVIKGLIDYFYSKKYEYKPHIITTSIEHHSILNVCKHLEEFGLATVTYIQPNANADIDLENIKQMITPYTILVSIMTVNNVLGTIQNIKEIGTYCREKQILFHTDAVQAIGKINIDVEECNIDMLTCSGHKIHTPKGIGFVYIRNSEYIKPLLHGGLQENGLRAGTENIPYIKALQYCMKKYTNPLFITGKEKYINILNNYLMQNLIECFTDIQLFEGDIGTINIAFKDIISDPLVWDLGQQNIYVSIGSACDNGSFEDNYVLKSLNYSSDYIKGNIRITFDENNTIEECEQFIGILKDNILKLRGYL